MEVAVAGPEEGWAEVESVCADCVSAGCGCAGCGCEGCGCEGCDREDCAHVHLACPLLS